MRGYGYFAREIEQGETPDYQNCRAYTVMEEQETFNDWWFKSGQFFNTFALALGGLGMLIILSSCCLAFHPAMFEKLLLWIYLLAAISQGLGFLGFGTKFCATHICKVGPGTAMAISAFMMWLTCANTVKSMPEALPPEDYDPDENYDSDDDDMYYYDDKEKDDENSYDSDDEVRDVNDQNGPAPDDQNRPAPERDTSKASVTTPEIV